MIENWKIESKKQITSKYPPGHCPECGSEDTVHHVWYRCRACGYEWRETGEPEKTEQEDVHEST